MAATLPVSRPASNRRHRVRQKVHVPAYATFEAPPGQMLELYEVLDISENGVALQCSMPLEVDEIREISLDLAETEARITVRGRVAWSSPEGRVGFSLPLLPDSESGQLQEWLFLNVMAAAANAESCRQSSENSASSAIRQDYSDILSAATAVQREAESLGADLPAVLALIASRSRSLLRTSGAAIALERPDEVRDTGEDSQDESQLDGKIASRREGAAKPREMICRAADGPSAPPVGLTLQVGAGFSGECVRKGMLLRCDDTELDERVDGESCRVLGIRSILASPVRLNEKVIGLLEVFSPKPAAFGEDESAVLARFAETIAAAVRRSVRPTGSVVFPVAAKEFSPAPGSVLFVNPPPNNNLEETASEDPDNVGGIRLPRAQLYLLMAVAATIFLALGFISAPWLQSRVQPWIRKKFQSPSQSVEQTVLASEKVPVTVNSVGTDLSTNAGNLPRLQSLAEKGNASAENALGLLYATGDEVQGIKRDEKESARWFTQAAEHGDVSAQSKLGSLYWGGRGLPKDDGRAYFWTLLARASGDDASKALAPFIATRLTPAQRSAIEQQADQWLQQHDSAIVESTSR